MITVTNVHCGAERPSELNINVDTVYKRYNIHEYTDSEGREGWEYDEDQLTLVEYFKEIIPEDENALGELSILFAAYQQQNDIALAELSIALGEAINNV